MTRQINKIVPSVIILFIGICLGMLIAAISWREVMVKGWAYDLLKREYEKCAEDRLNCNTQIDELNSSYLGARWLKENKVKNWRKSNGQENNN